MHYAHAIFRSGFYTWSNALTEAWNIHYLRHYLRRGIVRFTYVKKDGTLREARIDRPILSDFRKKKTKKK